MPASPEFDQKWSSLAQEEVDVFYIEDDRGEGLMGNVRRARGKETGPRRGAAARPRRPDAEPRRGAAGDPAELARACEPATCASRADGDQRSGKAIVSFQIGPAGDIPDTKVDAPAFQGTSLPNCVSGTVSRWAFPSPKRAAWQSATRSSSSAGRRARFCQISP